MPKPLAALAIAVLLFLTARYALAQNSLTVVTVGGVQTDDMTPLVYAVRSGTFRKAGLDVQLLPATSGAATTSAVLAGAFDIGKSSLLSLMNAHLRHLPVVVIAAGVVNDPRVPFAKLVVATDSTLHDGQDFNGKTIAVSGLNDLSTVAVDAWVDKNGGDAQSLHFLEMPASSMSAAVMAHRVDGAFIVQPYLAQAVASKQVRPIADAYDAIAPGFVESGLFTKTDYATKHPDVIRAFVRTMYEAALYANGHHDQTMPMMVEFTKVPAAVYTGMTRAFMATATDPNGFQQLIDAAAKYRVIPEVFPAKDFLWLN